eukprot:scaffold81_cov115-Isochrysis_galbana.AAC.7
MDRHSRRFVSNRPLGVIIKIDGGRKGKVRAARHREDLRVRCRRSAHFQAEGERGVSSSTVHTRTAVAAPFTVHIVPLLREGAEAAARLSIGRRSRLRRLPAQVSTGESRAWDWMQRGAVRSRRACRRIRTWMLDSSGTARMYGGGSNALSSFRSRAKQALLAMVAGAPPPRVCYIYVLRSSRAREREKCVKDRDYK